MDEVVGGGVADAAGLFGGALAPAAPPPSPPPRVAPPPPGYLGHRARLRRRLVEGGPAALLDRELLEVVLFLALPRRDTKPIADALMRRFGGLAGAVTAPAAALGAAAPGLGEAGVAALKAMEASALRLSGAAAAERPVLDTRDRLAGYLTAAPARGRAERLRVLFLDGHDRLLADEAQGQGAADGAPVCPREIVRRALEVGATALVLVRRDPGRGPTPSPADAEAAEEVKAAAGAFSIAVRDHPVAGRGRRASPSRGGPP